MPTTPFLPAFHLYIYSPAFHLYTYSSAFHLYILHMDLSEHHDTYDGNDKYRRFFAANGHKSWGFNHFKSHFDRTLRNPPSSNTLKSSYRRCLDAIKKDPSTPNSIKQEVEKLLKEV